MRSGSTNSALYYLTVVVAAAALLTGHLVESTGALKLTTANFDSTLSSHELVFVNFYANWCRFSQMLEPIFDEFATKAAQEFPADKLSIAKVDCDAENQVATQNHVNKYPTLKLYRYGQAAKKEYRGARSLEAFMSYVKEQLESKMKVVHDSSKLIETLHENKKRTIIGYFQNENSDNYKTFLKLSSLLRDSCLFVSYLGDLTSVIHDTSERVTFKDMTSPDLATHEIIYDSGRITEYEKLFAWADERCTPLVREITFENAEELTEEGLPFLILFRKPDDDDSLRSFERQVQNQLMHMKHTINCVYADGNKFTHPLHHLGKTVNDLPVLAIDSFRHMYLFPDFKKLGEGSQLLQFVQDLHSGKLHREFHNGPDPTTPAPAPGIELHVGSGGQHVPKIPDSHDDPNSIRVNPSTPPESVFIKLAPSRERYSLKYDGEL